jgi:hypothetical protein
LATQVVEEVTNAIRRLAPVDSVTLVGSRRDNTAGLLSDWDFAIDSGDLRSVETKLPDLVSTYGPLAAFWDPLGDRRNYMAIFPGLVKLDLHLDLPSNPHEPWKVSPDTLAELDAHFWDWILWLAGKKSRGRTELVSDELLKMHRFLLGPLGSARPPKSIESAVSTYRSARTAAEHQWAVSVSGGALEAEVVPALERHGLLTRGSD